MRKSHLIIAAVGMLASELAVYQSEHHTVAAESMPSVGCAGGANPTIITNPYITVVGKEANLLQWVTTPLPPASTPVPQSGPWYPSSSPGVTSWSSPLALVPTAESYGIVNYISGIIPSYLSPDETVGGTHAENEISEFFTYDTAVSSVQDLTNGALQENQRTGTFTIRLGYGSWSNPETFRNGSPVLSGSFTEQITNPIASNMAGTTLTPNPITTSGSTPNVEAITSSLLGTSSVPSVFTKQGQLTITAVKPFSYNGTCYQLGSVGQKMAFSGSGPFSQVVALNMWQGALTAFPS